MKSEEVIGLFREVGALLEGHFQLSSGLHSAGYLQCALVLQYPWHAEALGSAIAERVRSLNPTVVISPALGGVVIGQEVSRALGVRGIFAERKGGELTIRRGFSVETSDRIVVIEDVVTTGKSTQETVVVARASGGTVVGVASIFDRSNTAASFDVPFQSLASVSWPAYARDGCPQCADGIPIVKPGSRPGV